MKMFSAQLQSLKRQADAAPWLKWAALAVAVLMLLLMIQALDQVRTQQQKAAIEAEVNLRRTLALKGQDVWLEREKSALQMRDSLRAQLPEVATPGLAQAALQSWLREASSGFDGEQNVRVTVNRSGLVESVPGILRVNASFSGGLTPRQALNLLRRIETAPTLVVVESMTLQSDSNQTLNLTLNAYYRSGNTGAASP